MVAGGDGAVAHHLEGQDGEGLLDLDAHLLDAEEEEGDDDLGRDDGPVVPRLAWLDLGLGFGLGFGLGLELGLGLGSGSGLGLGCHDLPSGSHSASGRST